MLLKDKILTTGNVLFKYRGYQFFIYLVVIALNLRNLSLNKNTLYYELICLGVVLLGMLVRALTVGYVSVGTSGRNSNQQEAAKLNTTGAYSIARNPLYIGNFLICTGIIMLSHDWTSIILNSVLYWIFYMPIILTEEAFLLDKFKDAYQKFADEVNCVIPCFKKFVKPDSKFSTHFVLMREHDTLLTTMIAFIAMLIIKNYVTTGKFYLEPLWIKVSILTLISWSILKYIKKYRGSITNLFSKICPTKS